MLTRLYDRIQNDSAYRSETMGRIFVPGKGRIGAGLPVFVGEAPGREEETRGEPFVGAAGKNLNVLLGLVGLQREAIFITNLVKYRPFSPTGANRPPSAAESRRALPFLLEELRVLEPRVVVCLGLSVARALTGDAKLRMEEVNGRVIERNGLRLFVTYHPSPLNYNVPAKRASMEAAFRLLRGTTDHTFRSDAGEWSERTP